MLVDNGQLAAGRGHIQAPNGRVQLQDVDRKRIVHKDLENLLVGGNKGLVSINNGYAIINEKKDIISDYLIIVKNKILKKVLDSMLKVV